MGLLAGVRVLDLSIWRPGPYATQLLAELGADVVKVEPPGGDPMRAYPELFAGLHAGKRSIVLDLKDPSAQRLALELIAGADVVVEGYRPGVADRLGVGYDAARAVNDSIVYCSVSGYGQEGALASLPGHDVDYQAWAGVLAPDGGEPVEAKVPIADLSGGMAAALAVCAAVAHRARTGEGERIDVAMTDVLATWTGAATATNRDLGARTGGVPGYGTFPAADGWVALGVVTEDHFWQPLCRALGLHDRALLRFAERAALLDELQEELRAAIAGRARDEVVEALQAAGVPVAPVLSRAEMLDVAHLRERGVVVDVPWAAGPAIGHPVRYAQHPASPASAPPALGEHDGATWRPR